MTGNIGHLGKSKLASVNGSRVHDRKSIVIGVVVVVVVVILIGVVVVVVVVVV